MICHVCFWCADNLFVFDGVNNYDKLLIIIAIAIKCYRKMVCHVCFWCADNLFVFDFELFWGFKSGKRRCAWATPRSKIPPAPGSIQHDQRKIPLVSRAVYIQWWFQKNIKTSNTGPCTMSSSKGILWFQFGCSKFRVFIITKVPWPGIEPGTFRSSVWRSPNWAIAANKWSAVDQNCKQNHDAGIITLIWMVCDNLNHVFNSSEPKFRYFRNWNRWQIITNYQEGNQELFWLVFTIFHIGIYWWIRACLSVLSHLLGAPGGAKGFQDADSNTSWKQKHKSAKL